MPASAALPRPFTRLADQWMRCSRLRCTSAHPGGVREIVEATRSRTQKPCSTPAHSVSRSARLVPATHRVESAHVESTTRHPRGMTRTVGSLIQWSPPDGARRATLNADHARRIFARAQRSGCRPEPHLTVHLLQSPRPFLQPMSRGAWP